MPLKLKAVDQQQIQLFKKKIGSDMTTLIISNLSKNLVYL